MEKKYIIQAGIKIITTVKRIGITIKNILNIITSYIGHMGHFQRTVTL